ncbi:hypothetical protein [Aneurinibacillus migulanus]|nr:hypothetical protein [Aneurinibacillus migulanus]KIV56552.1 hypothetical protein TS65_12045 [Aneurinibacillus migulanus]KON95311.1 hypothetical protein AF333_07265 [Aneurinibacillus migulanus]MED0893745.1 hypothetical protein [Aneurinibacillus migulanus]MED1617751.1 hypothetical protein [Aneurinibacillus migulanus]
MEYMDEKLIELINFMQEKAAQQAEEDDREELLLEEMEEISLLENRVQISLPRAFDIMSPEIAALKYPSEKRPNVIYTDESTTINIGFNYTKTPLDSKEMDVFKDDMVQILQKTQPIAQWFEDGVEEVDRETIGYCEFLVSALDANVYVLLFFVELDGNALLCTFNCLEHEMKEWKPIAREIMYSVKIHTVAKGEIDI